MVFAFKADKDREHCMEQIDKLRVQSLYYHECNKECKERGKLLANNWKQTLCICVLSWSAVCDRWSLEAGLSCVHLQGSSGGQGDEGKKIQDNVVTYTVVSRKYAPLLQP